MADIRERLARIETTGQHIHHDVRSLTHGHYQLDIRTRDLEGRMGRMEARVQRRRDQSAQPPERKSSPPITDQVRSILHYTIAALVLILVLLGKISGAEALGAVLNIFGLG